MDERLQEVKKKWKRQRSQKLMERHITKKCFYNSFLREFKNFRFLFPDFPNN